MSSSKFFSVKFSPTPHRMQLLTSTIIPFLFEVEVPLSPKDTHLNVQLCTKNSLLLVFSLIMVFVWHVILCWLLKQLIDWLIDFADAFPLELTIFVHLYVPDSSSLECHAQGWEHTSWGSMFTFIIIYVYCYYHLC